MRRGHVPQRTCAGCGAQDAKSAMVRVVRTPTGAVEIDTRGGAHGRGAYVHRSALCIDAALSHGRLAKVLRSGVSTETAGRLREFGNRE